METEKIKELLRRHKPSLMETGKHSAVLIPFVEREGQLCLLFEQRSSGISAPGEVCFPGGRMEAGEDPLAAALRETEEELGIKGSDILYAAQFDTLSLYANMAIHSAVAVLDPGALSRIKLAEEEVTDWFTIPVDWLRRNKPFVYEYKVVPEIGEDFPYDMIDAPDKYSWRTGKSTVPIWVYEGRCLWGISARIVVHLLNFID